MRTAAFAVVILFLTIGVASAATQDLWAIDAGTIWGFGLSSTVGLDPFSTNAVDYPSSLLDTVEDAAYIPSTSTLYLSGNGPDNTQWHEQNTIAVYNGGPAGVSLTSYSNQGMAGYNWLGGIEYLDGSLYAVGYEDLLGDVFLIRVDNPGTPSQMVTQVGDYFGDADSFGIPYALCSDSSGSLIGAFTPLSSQDGESYLYSIDPLTGVASLLHTYPEDALDSSKIEGLDRFGDKLYALTTDGMLYEIDETTYEPTELGSVPSSCWTALVAIPEPSSLILLGSGISVLLVFCKCR